MNKPFLLSIAGIVVLFGVLLSCKNMGGGGAQHEITMEQNYISIRPVKALEPADRAALEKILHHAKKSLFEIGFYHNGGLTGRVGTLACFSQADIDETSRDAKARNLSDCAFQIGADRVEGLSSPVVACRIAAADGAQADALLARVKPILGKYASR